VKRTAMAILILYVRVSTCGVLAMGILQINQNKSIRNQNGEVFVLVYDSSWQVLEIGPVFFTVSTGYPFRQFSLWATATSQSRIPDSPEIY
jgi:hypothetical protein